MIRGTMWSIEPIVAHLSGTGRRAISGRLTADRPPTRVRGSPITHPRIAAGLPDWERNTGLPIPPKLKLNARTAMWFRPHNWYCPKLGRVLINRAWCTVVGPVPALPCFWSAPPPRQRTFVSASGVTGFPVICACKGWGSGTVQE